MKMNLKAKPPLIDSKTFFSSWPAHHDTLKRMRSPSYDLEKIKNSDSIQNNREQFITLL